LSGITSVTISSGGGSYGSSGSFTGTLYNARLTGGSGSNATANLGVAAGIVTSVTIVDPGSSYNVGDSLSIVGVATTAGFTPATLVVSTINSGVGEVIRVSGITSISYSPFNSYYRISSIVNASSVNVVSESTLPSTTVNNSNVSSANASILGKAVAISTSTFAYDSTTGITTFTTSGTPHGLIPGSKVRIVGSGQTFFNGNFSVANVVGLNTFSVSAGIGSTLASLSGSVYLYPTLYSSQSGSSDEEISTFSGRCNTLYAGIATSLSSAIVSLTSTSISLTNALTTGLKKGDYIVVDSEIMRIRDNNLSIVSRGLLGTKASTHVSGSIVRKINIIPTEFRRNSIIRASNHAFEYTGYGPGNYSTGLPSEQTKVLSKEEQLLSQAAKIGGGIVVYTGMNANGDFYIGNKKVSSATGQEEVFDSPIPTFTGEDISETGVNIGFDVLSPLEVTVTRSLKVNGGEKNNIISKFDGPVVFNNKITSYSEDGIETTSLLLQGDAKVSVKNTVGISTPTYPGSYGDRVQNANPDSGGYEGWVYTTKNRWEKYGVIGNLDTAPGISSETFIVNEDNAAQVRYPMFTNIGTGKTNTIYIDTNSITFTPSTGILTVTGVAATSSLTVGTFTTISSNMIMHTGSVNVSENINISGQIRVKENQIIFIDSNNNYISLAGPSTVGISATFRLPTSDGTNGQVLQTNGSGQLSWLTISVPTPVPVGGIIMWSGAIAAIPSGWALCNGQTVGSVVTPDLRDRFIVGAGSNYSVGATGGANSVTLTTDQIPSHTHTISPANVLSQINGGPTRLASSPSGTPLSYEVATQLSSTGGGQAHENRPPYYALAYIMRIS
jgi:microcystin-dependent protein